MRSILYIIAVILIIIWVISFLVYHVTGGLIHILLVIAVISIILGGNTQGIRFRNLQIKF